MIKTQIQLPERLYGELKHMAEVREWSLAETIRRAAEQFLASHPTIEPPVEAWEPPVSKTAGWKGLNHQQVRGAALADMEPLLPRKSRS